MMNTNELMNRLMEDSTDKSGIRDRFMGSADLYAQCFEDFMAEPNFQLLERAIAEKNCKQGFEAAHALKGVSGNLGLSGFYHAIFALVESLRKDKLDRVDAEYREVMRQYALLQAIQAAPAKPAEPQAVLSPPQGESDAVEPQAELSPPQGESATGKQQQNTGALFIPLSIMALIAVFSCIGLLFWQMIIGFEHNTYQESGVHLEQISDTIKLYIESKLDIDWRIAQSVGDSLQRGKYDQNAQDIQRLLQNKRDIWGVTDLMVYTEAGYSVYTDGRTAPNDVASDMLYEVRQSGSLLSIIDSKITYTIPLDTDISLNGSNIAAVSVVQSMETFLDEMGFSSFDGAGRLYLTESSGIVISRLSSPEETAVFNVMSLTENKTLEALDSSLTAANLLEVPESTTFLMSDGTTESYVVTTPVTTKDDNLRLFFVIPSDEVNRTMDSFSNRLTMLSLLVILGVAVFAIFYFLYMYRIRKRQFDKEMLARDRMFDMLVQHTHTAFGLFSVNQGKPTYVSGNSNLVVGDTFLRLQKNQGVYSMKNSGDTNVGGIVRLNEVMADWDGKSEFKSGYIQNDQVEPPSYFEIQLYPTDNQGMDFVGIARDVTAAFEREKATKDALLMAEKANEAKSQFLSNMSHDIRTPMNVIINMIDFASEELDNKQKLQENLQIARESSEHLLLLINDILDMSRIESGNALIEAAPFSIKTELNRLRNIITPLCTAKSQIFITEFAGVQTDTVLGDRAKVSKILMNLLSNAVKFTPNHGAIRFTAAEIPSMRAHYTNIRFTVEDTGIGISKTFLEHIFEPFARADDKRVSKIQGTGLGLSICHSYVAAMGGLLKCESEEGEGSKFSVELFFERTDTMSIPKISTNPLDSTQFAGKRCLMCEDNLTNQRIAKAVLERLGFCVEVAGDGREGLIKFTRSQVGYYDAIYMDIQMPEMDGYETTVAIRDSDHPQARTIPIIAMTANSFIEDVEKARIAGMDGHIGKPITTSTLSAETQRVFQTKNKPPKQNVQEG